MNRYFYYPLSAFNGAVLKCGGIATDANRDAFLAEHPGTIILDGYRGDRIVVSGKSSIVHEIAEERGWPVIDVKLADAERAALCAEIVAKLD
jgi:hypothetical protein